ncbi:glycosyltransferase family 4 protein [Butyrivibrio fibrisolvens]|uniref:glycosyltransferase family 4 protein n=1 Tax=Butyrivibrio fibrisolvens TaxID=831 RepID=UPI00040780A6|nr:glycosyltransferase family 1 protein [Butyrivibrio fibrisolvens]
MIRLLVDISPILHGELCNNNKTGIYRVAMNLLKQFSSDTRIDLFYCCKPQYFSIIDACDGNLIKKDRVINYTRGFEKLSSIRNKVYKKKMHSARKSPIWFFSTSLVELLDIILFNYNRSISRLDKYDAFFSAYEQHPRKILKSHTLIKALYIHDITMIIHPDLYKNTKNNPIYKIVSTMSNQQIFFANSEHTKKDFLTVRPDINPDNIVIAYPGCDLCPVSKINVRQKYAIKTEKYAFVLCSVAPNKNLNRIVKTFLKFVRTNSITDITLVMGGALDGDYGKRLMNDFKLLPDFEKYINYIGYAPEEDLPDLYANAFFFVFTSCYEGFGVPPLEAMKCGCPVIASDSSSLPEVVGNAGILIPWNDDDAHISAYTKYYYDDRFRKQCIQLGYSQSEHFKWEKTENTIVSKIEDKLHGTSL